MDIASGTMNEGDRPPAEGGVQPRRRDFLGLVATAATAVGVGAVVWPFIDYMLPAADVIAAGGGIDVDLGSMAPGQQVTVLWRGKPILVVNRTSEMLHTLQEPSMINRLRDPESLVHQQPSYAVNWHRSIKPEYVVLVGICTHLGCLPGYFPKPDPSQPVVNWPGGYFCPCHGSKYDLAGRVWDGVPAPYNLPVPPYHFPDAKTIRIGENPTGQVFDLNSVVQL